MTLLTALSLGTFYPAVGWPRPGIEPDLVKQPRLCGADHPGIIWQRTELLFGLSGPGLEPITPEQFQAFVDQEVTPRFPNGLTLISAYGQYQNAAGTIIAEDAKVLILLYPVTPNRNQAIEAIRQAYKTLFAQESVLRVDSLVCISG